METKEGGCQCGRVRFRVPADLDGVTTCNCSICTKKGILHLVVPPERFELLSGKRDPGESDVVALAREVDEELGCRVAAESARALGVFDAEAANEPGFRVRAAVYAVDVEGPIMPRAEIDQVVWVDPRALPDLP